MSCFNPWIKFKKEEIERTRNLFQTIKDKFTLVHVPEKKLKEATDWISENKEVLVLNDDQWRFFTRETELGEPTMQEILDSIKRIITEDLYDEEVIYDFHVFGDDEAVLFTMRFG